MYNSERKSYGLAEDGTDGSNGNNGDGSPEVADDPDAEQPDAEGITRPKIP